MENDTAPGDGHVKWYQGAEGDKNTPEVSFETIHAEQTNQKKQ